MMKKSSKKWKSLEKIIRNPLNKIIIYHNWDYLLGADVNRDVVPLDRRSALHFAAAGGHLAAVKYLVNECGAESKKGFLKTLL